MAMLLSYIFEVIGLNLAWDIITILFFILFFNSADIFRECIENYVAVTFIFLVIHYSLVSHSFGAVQYKQDWRFSQQ
jgi:hypothetical protein